MVVVPAVIPVTTPVALTVPTAVLLLLQTPPPVASVSAVVRGAHTTAVPVIIPGGLITVTAVVEFAQAARPASITVTLYVPAVSEGGVAVLTLLV
jgi:hypothetical protein